MKIFDSFNRLGLALAAPLLALLPLAGAAQQLFVDNTTLAVQQGAVLYVGGGVRTTTSTTLLNNGTVQLTGDLTHAGTLGGTGLLRFGGSTDQTLAAPAATALPQLEVANTGPASGNRLLVPNDLTITGTLILTQGMLRTQGNGTGATVATLSLPDGASVVGEAAGRYVQGRLRVTRATVAGTSPVDFTNGASLTPQGQSLGPVTITRTAGLQTAGVSYGTNAGGTTKGIDRVWEVVASQQPSAAAPAALTFTWVSDDDNGLNPAAATQFWRADRGTGLWVAQAGTSSTSLRSLTAPVAQLGFFTVSSPGQPLPVTLVSFTAQRQQLDGLLTWTTASELNNDHFVVESSADGRTFWPLGQVAGHGTSIQPHSYQFLDANLPRYVADVVYYRLRQVDADGTSTYSPVRLVQVPASEFAAEAFPTRLPGGQALSLRVRTPAAGPVSLLISDALGRTVGEQVLDLPAGTTTTLLPTAGHWATGLYLLRVRQGRQQQTLQVVRE